MNAQNWYSQIGLAATTPTKIDRLMRLDSAEVASPKLRLIVLCGFSRR